MTDNSLNGIIVLDVGSTNVKVTLFDSKLNLLGAKSMASVLGTNPYLHIDVEPVIKFFLQTIGEFDQILQVDAIVPSAHGSALALLDNCGELVLPIMSYQAEVPDHICREYEAIKPAFDEVYAPVNPGALALGRQLLWQETSFCDAFDQVETIVPLGQYIALRLSGKAVSEVTALGAQTHLWDPVAADFSKLAKQRGWAGKFAPMANAWQRLGILRGINLKGRGQVLAGIHDSNANLLCYLGQQDFCLLSTGTWIIAFDPGVEISQLDAARDQVSNTTLFGDPVACCRFMGGREFELLANNAQPELASLKSAAELIKNQVFALPSFTNSGGPLPNSSGQGKIIGQLPDDAEAHASLASIYCAQMTAIALSTLGALGTRNRIIVDGPFSTNIVFLSVLDNLLADCQIFSAVDKNGTSRGAAMLALIVGSQLPDIPIKLRVVEPAPIDRLSHYHSEWGLRQNWK